jgi:hypothetical protein
MSEHNKIRQALHLAPEIVEHVVSLIGSKGVAGERVDGSKDAPLPFNLQAFNDVNEVYQRLVYWSVFIAGKLGVQAPGPAVRAWRAYDGTVVGLPYAIAPAGARYVTGVMSKWLDLHLSEASACMLATDLDYFADELKDVFRVAARWPMADLPKFGEFPCPDDGGRIAIYPPNVFEAAVVFVCESCGKHLTESAYAHVAYLFREVHSASRVTKHLMAKYGRSA